VKHQKTAAPLILNATFKDVALMTGASRKGWNACHSTKNHFGNVALAQVVLELKMDNVVFANLLNVLLTSRVQQISLCAIKQR
jgi:hypothetical protein